MKKIALFLMISAVMTAITSCKKDEPAQIIAGTYTGSFDGKWMGNDTITSSGFMVVVSEINDNKVRVESSSFNTFEVLVTTNGLNVQPISNADPALLDFLYIGADKRLKFTYNQGANEARFIGTK